MKQKLIELTNSIWQWTKGLWPWYKNLYKGRPWYVKTLVGIVSMIAAFFIYLGAVDMNFLLPSRTSAPIQPQRFIVPTV